MALGSTMHNITVDLYIDRGVYESLDFRMAMHPAESPEYMVTRLLAYYLEYTEGIEFTPDLSNSDEPAIVVRDLTGRVVSWIEVGIPNAERGSIDELAARLQRRMRMSLSVSERHLYLSPIEHVRYLDELDSPWARACVDVGNMVFGYPEHWIRTAGTRIIKLHVKDFRLDAAKGTFAWGSVGTGDVDWTEVRSALADVGFAGWATNTGIPMPVTTMERFRQKLEVTSGMPRSMSRFFSAGALGHHSHLKTLQDVARRFEHFRNGAAQS